MKISKKNLMAFVKIMHMEMKYGIITETFILYK